ncbi:MAG: hypothetical protein GX074_02025 [Erysipelothrix sp.]|nr:hypothetical protein [Erysipelothrix sp.]
MYFNLKVIDNTYSTSHIKHIELIDSEGNKFFAENQEYMLKEDYFGLYKNTTHSFTLNLTNHDIDKLIINEAVLYYNDLRVQTIVPESFTFSVENFSDIFSVKTAKHGNDLDYSLVYESWGINTDLKLIRVDNCDDNSSSTFEINGMDYKQAVNKSFAKPSLINLEIKTPIKDFEKLAYSNFDSYATLVFENNQQ